jgi:hypothetical protein
MENSFDLQTFERELDLLLFLCSKKFLTIGRMLIRLQSSKGWRIAGYRNIDSYCKIRFGMSKTALYRHIKNSKTFDTLTIEDTHQYLACTSALEILGRVPPEIRQSLWDQYSVEIEPTIPKLRQLRRIVEGQFSDFNNEY